MIPLLPRLASLVKGRQAASDAHTHLQQEVDYFKIETSVGGAGVR